jgi:hypothetical protein
VSPDLKSRAQRNLLAVAGDDPGALQVPRFRRDDVRAITEFLMQKLSLKLGPHAARSVAAGAA